MECRVVHAPSNCRNLSIKIPENYKKKSPARKKKSFAIANIITGLILALDFDVYVINQFILKTIKADKNIQH